MPSLMAASSLTYSGCETVPTNNDPGMGLAVLGALAGVRGAQLGAQGNMQGALASQALGNVAGGMADYERQRATAEAGRSQVIVNAPNVGVSPSGTVTGRLVSADPQPHSIPSAPVLQEKIVIYVANKWEDSNRDGFFQSNELVGLEKSSFKITEPIELGVYSENSSGQPIKIRYREVSSQIAIDSPFFLIRGNMAIRKNFQPGEFSKGIYRFEAISDKNQSLGSTFFEVIE